MSGKRKGLERGWSRLEQGDSEEALRIAEELLADRPEDADSLHLAGSALLELREHEASLERLDRALELEPSNDAVRGVRAWALYETCRFEEGLREVDRLISRGAGGPDALYLKGLLMDHLGRRNEADACFAEAARLEPENYPIPVTVDSGAFEDAVGKALESLPELFRDAVREVPILVEDLPSADLLATMERPDPDLLGLFTGTPLTGQSPLDLPAVPSTIHLFKRNLERACSDREHLVEEIRITLLHEIGHYLGMDEEDLEDAGYG